MEGSRPPRARSPRFQLSSLRVRLLLLVLLALLPALALIVYTAVEQRRAAVAEAQRSAFLLAQSVAHEHRRVLVSTRDLLRALAQLPEVRERDWIRCRGLFVKLLAEQPLYLNLGVIGPDGQLLCSALYAGRDINLADRAYFRRAVATRDFAIGDYQIGRATGKASVNVGYPVVGPGAAVEAVVFAALDLNSLRDLALEAALPEGSSFTLVDQSGTIVVRHPEPERWVGKSLPDLPAVAVVRRFRVGVAEAAGLDAVPRLFGFTPLLDGEQAGDLYVSIGIPKRAALADTQRLLMQNLVGLGVVGALTLVAVWFGSNVFVLRRVGGLVDATRRLARGDAAARVGGSYQGELGELARSFDEMAEALERMQQSEKMAVLGRMAAGVAHELRNPLAVLDGRLQLLGMARGKGEPLPPADLERHLRPLESAAERMKKIIEGLSNYSKPAKAEPMPLNLAEVLSNVRDLVAPQARKGTITVAFDGPSDLRRVVGDRSEMIQILLNLATNALEAMAEPGGTLTLRARAVSGDNGAAQVVIEVADTGPGIPADALKRIWQAFYTTKVEGTGLGLSIVRGLVEKQPGASITVESAVGVGTTFRVTMPAV